MSDETMRESVGAPRLRVLTCSIREMPSLGDSLPVMTAAFACESPPFPCSQEARCGKLESQVMHKVTARMLDDRYTQR